MLREALKRKAFWCEQRDDLREKVVSSCCSPWVDPTAHWTTTLLLTFTTLVAYCDKHAIDVISVILRFYNRFVLIVIILWLTVLALIDWWWVWTLRVVIWSPMWFSLNIKTFGPLYVKDPPHKFPFCVAALGIFFKCSIFFVCPKIHWQTTQNLVYKNTMVYCSVKV